MAFLVCYSNAFEDHAKEKAKYLDQSFYESLFRFCDSNDCELTGFQKIASLKYKSPRMLLDQKFIRQLLKEIDQLPEHLQRHEGTQLLMQTMMHAISKGCLLTISADMYPEL